MRRIKNNAKREKKNAMNQVKECDGLNETLHFFLFLYGKDELTIHFCRCYYKR